MCDAHPHNADRPALDHPALLELRGRLQEVETLMQRGVTADADTGTEYYTGYAYRTLYDWDQYFEAIMQVYMGWPSRLICNGVRLFLDHQRDDGHIARSVPSNEFHDPEHVKPFLAQTAWLVHRYYGQTAWILNETYYPRLRRYLDYWLSAMDSTGDGLSEWMSAPHTGMDNQHERAGHWMDRTSKGVDLNSYLVRELRAFSRLAASYGRPEDAHAYETKADELATRVRTLLWDDEAGFFFDRHARTGVPIRVWAVSGLLPLWAGIADRTQADRLVYDHLLNAGEFWAPYPVATLSRTEPGYSAVGYPSDVLGENSCSWRANTWIPTNYMVYRGLRAYGYDQAASALARATTRLIVRSGNREWYDAETGDGRGLDPFWGWSLLAHFLPFEEVSGEDPTSLGG